MSKHSERMQTEAEGFDDKLHILVYDIIYCAHTYGFYAGMPIKKIPVKVRVSNAIKEQENAERSALLAEKEAHLRSMECELISIKDLSGYTVKHKVFGEGRVVSHKEKYIIVDFSGNEKKFVIPDSVICGFLKFAEEAVNEEILAYNQQIKNINTIKKEIESLKSLIDSN